MPEVEDSQEGPDDMTHCTNVSTMRQPFKKRSVRREQACVARVRSLLVDSWKITSILCTRARIRSGLPAKRPRADVPVRILDSGDDGLGGAAGPRLLRNWGLAPMEIVQQGRGIITMASIMRI
jgi:hypothetical protein